MQHRTVATALIGLLCLALAAPLAAQTEADPASPPAPASAPAATAPDRAAPACVGSELQIVSPPSADPAPPLYRLGDTLRIQASGGCAQRLRSRLAEGRAGPLATLVLDAVEMRGLKPGAPLRDDAAGLVLSFPLARDSQDDSSRDAWDALLKKQRQGYTMTLPVALAVAGDAATVVRPGTLRLKVADKAGIYAVLIGGVALFVGLFYGLIRFSSALRDQGDGPYSLGKSQMAFWGLLIALSFVGVFLLTGSMERIPDQVLVLMGISGATGLGAILIGAGKAPPATRKAALEDQAGRRELSVAEQGQLARLYERVARDHAQARAAPLRTLPQFFFDICNDGDGTSVHRLQVVVWTVVLGGVFVWTVAQVMSMPQFPDTLLMLLGISNGTYLGFKIPEQ
ncbi:MAG TPA: hypothetical protein VLA16_15945 [Ideonella sp.]|nr:hypothetical protein [Ideonella sp.]